MNKHEANLLRSQERDNSLGAVAAIIFLCFWIGIAMWAFSDKGSFLEAASHFDGGCSAGQC